MLKDRLAKIMRDQWGMEEFVLTTSWQLALFFCNGVSSLDASWDDKCITAFSGSLVSLFQERRLSVCCVDTYAESLNNVHSVSSHLFSHSHKMGILTLSREPTGKMGRKKQLNPTYNESTSAQQGAQLLQPLHWCHQPYRKPLQADDPFPHPGFSWIPVKGVKNPTQ